MLLQKYAIAKGVDGYYIENPRFNTTLITYNFYLPLNKNNMAINSLLPYILTSCSDEFKDYIDLNIALLELYGADLSCSVSKCGDCFHTKIGISVINDELAFEKDSPISKAAKMLSQFLFAPAVSDETFFDADIKREKRKTIERIEGEINNKRAYARTRLLEEMFGEDPYGKFIYGSVSEAEKISGQELFAAWRSLLSKAYVRINVIGKEYPKAVFDTAKECFSKIDRKEITDTKSVAFPKPSETITDITEYFDVTQGKLALGFTSQVKGSLKTATALSLFGDIFGGGPYSKLFSNVREKQSLCYYCSASARRTKGVVTVESGIEKENAQKTIDAVLSELEEMQKGNFDDSVIESSKKSICDSLYGYYDNAAALDIWYSREINEDISPEEAAKIVMNITREEIVQAAKGVKLHTVYRLLPKEAKNNEN